MPDHFQIWQSIHTDKSKGFRGSKDCHCSGRHTFFDHNTFMRVIRATINCFSHSLASPLLDCEIPLELTSKGLFLVNLNGIVQAAAATKPSLNAATKIASETFLAAPEKSDEDVDAVSECSEPSNVNATKPNSQTTAEITPPFSSDIQRSGQNLHPATKLPAQDPSERAAIRKDLERHVVFAEPPEGTPGRSGCSTYAPVPSESDRLGTGEGQLWPEASGPYVHGRISNGSTSWCQSTPSPK